MSRFVSRTTIAALGLSAFAAATLTSAFAGGYYGGYAPYPYPSYGPTPCCANYGPVVAPYAPGPYSYGPNRLPPPPAVDLYGGPRYYHPNGYGGPATACYEQYVRIADGRGGWSWGVKSSCD